MSLRVGELHAAIKLDDKEFTQGVDRSESRFGGLAAGVARGGLLIAGALAGIATASGVMAAGFETNMANVGTLLGTEGTARVAELSQSVKGMSMETGKPLDDLAGGLYQVVSAFGDTADSAEILRISAQASTAGLATTTDAVNLLSAVTKGYGDTSADAVRHASDLAFQTVKLGQTSFPELAASMGQVVPLAATLGVQQTELFGAMATLTGVTGNTAAVTTQLRAASQALINTNPKMLEQLNALGYANGAAAVEALGFQGTLDALSGAVDGDTKKLAEMFGSVEALNAVLALTGAQSEDFTNKTAAMEDAVGATAEAFEIQQQTVSASFGRIMASANVLMVNLGEKLLPLFQGILQWVLDNWDSIAAVFDAVFAAVGNTITWLIENVWPLLLAAFTVFAEEVVPAVAEAIAWFADDILPGLIDTLTAIADVVLPAVGAAFGFLTDTVFPAIRAAVAFVEEQWEHFGPVLTGAAAAIAFMVGVELVLAFGAWAFAAAAAAVATIIALAPILIPIAAIALAVGGLAWVWSKFGDDIKRIVSDVGEWIGDVFGGIGAIVGGAWDVIAGAVKGGINTVIGMVNGVIGFLNGIRIPIPRVEIPGTDIGLGGGFFDPFNISRIPRLAGGGRILREGLAIIGEQGPELVHMRPGSDVYNAGQTAGLLGGELLGRDPFGRLVQVYVENINGVQPGDVEREVRSAIRREELRQLLNRRAYGG